MVREAVGVGETLVLAQEMACQALAAAQQEESVDVHQLPGKKHIGNYV